MLSYSTSQNLPSRRQRTSHGASYAPGLSYLFGPHSTLWEMLVQLLPVSCLTDPLHSPFPFEIWVSNHIRALYTFLCPWARPQAFKKKKPILYVILNSIIPPLFIFWSIGASGEVQLPYITHLPLCVCLVPIMISFKRPHLPLCKQRALDEWGLPAQILL